jgi:hypothetical protein
MRASDRIQIDEELSEALRRQGLADADLDSFLAYSGGRLVSRRSKRNVRTLELRLDDTVRHYFLKQARGEGWRVFSNLLRPWRNAQVSTSRERDLVEMFRQAGFSVMRVVGWGERRRFGLPVAGMLLVERVDGEEYVVRYARSSLRRRRVMMRAYGRLVGQLHQAGIDSKVRPRDLICNGEDLDDPRSALVVIDRERGRLSREALLISRRMRQLAEVWIQFGRTLGLPKPSELLAFMAGYLRDGAMPARGRAMLFRDIQREARAIVRTERRSAKLRAEFEARYGNPTGTAETNSMGPSGTIQDSGAGRLSK